MTGISYRIDGTDRSRAALNAAHRRLDDATPLFEDIGTKLIGSTQERFDTETDPEGNPWPQSIRVMMEGGKTLTDTARLAGSITKEADRSSAEVGTNVIYGRIHQEGGTITARTGRGLRFRTAGANSDIIRRSVTIPRRAFLGLDPEDETEIEFLVGKYIAQDLGGAANVTGGA